MKETWVTVKGFPNYAVSNFGRVTNLESDKPLVLSRTVQGDFKVGLYFGGHRATMSVRRLVAEAFVPKTDHLSDTVILLDNNKSNLRADNLAWRPRWFAWQYHHQSEEVQRSIFYDLPIKNVTTGEVYESVVHCGNTEGMLYTSIWDSVMDGVLVYPTRCRYEVI